MNHKEFKLYKSKCINAFRAILLEQGKSEQLVEAAFCAYADPNPLIRFIFWRRLWLTCCFLESNSPYEAILDFGCGSGVILPFLTDFTNRVVGLDINLEPYHAFSTHLAVANNVEVYEMKKCLLSHFSDNSFEVVISLDVLEHVDDLHGIFTEFTRILKPGGAIIISGPTENFFYEIGRKIAGKEYTGSYHVRNIYDVRRAAKPFIKTRTFATLYYPCPLFKIFVGYVDM